LNAVYSALNSQVAAAYNRANSAYNAAGNTNATSWFQNSTLVNYAMGTSTSYSTYSNVSF
jgi:hypothetical protein